ncbi:MAG TPA: hypothetical protein VHO91_05395 [Rhodopila sp.]|nr:hypothetical protein [Rhodopila sp.]
MKSPPKQQVDSMPADRFFAYAAAVLKLQPAHATDQPSLALMRRTGFQIGKDFSLDDMDTGVRQALRSVPEDAQRLMSWKIHRLARVVNAWSMNTETMVVYGNDYLKRAVVAQVGLGANLPEDAIYPLNLGDEAGRPLDDANKYIEQIYIAFCQGCDAACFRLLVRHALRSGGLSGRQPAEPLCG